jgi:hypothetical protein
MQSFRLVPYFGISFEFSCLDSASWLDTCLPAGGRTIGIGRRAENYRSSHYRRTAGRRR